MNKQPERRIKEILEIASKDAGVHMLYKSGILKFPKLTKTLQAERQRCEEMVEAERERIIKWLEKQDILCSCVQESDGCSNCGGYSRKIERHEFIEKLLLFLKGIWNISEAKIE